jgi:GrxC family glutaredoxin
MGCVRSDCSYKTTSGISRSKNMDQFSQFIVTNWVLVLALVIILALLVRSYIGPGAAKTLGVMEAVKLINHKDAVVVDVRTDKEFAGGHILNAIHIPLGVFESKIQELDAYKDRPVIMSCQSGNRSSRALGLLKKRGFNEVYNLGGGVMAWQNANLPLTKKPTPKPQASEVKKKITEAETLEPGKTAQGGASVTVYITRLCPFCARAIGLLKNKGIAYQEVDISNNPRLREEMESRAKRQSVPQIFIGDTHVGGWDDMLALEQGGELDAMLGLCAG